LIIVFVNQPLDLTSSSVLLQLLNSERLSIFAADLQVSFLLFEALRTHLKFQLEFYLTRVIDIIISDSPKIIYEQKEIALGNLCCCTLHTDGVQCDLYVSEMQKTPEAEAEAEARQGWLHSPKLGHNL
jgi:hypothetical protein